MLKILLTSYPSKQGNKMRSQFCLGMLILVAVLFGPLSALGRISYHWSFAELTDKADIIIIAEPIHTQETGEKTELSENISPPVPVLGIETELKVLAVLKGKINGDKLTIHHYKFVPYTGVMMSGPSLVYFSKKSNVSNQYMLFLKASPEGKFEPLSGQVDPAHSIFRLSHGR